MITSICGALGVILGAMGSHMLRDSLSNQDLASFKTGVWYHQLHTVVLFCMALLYRIYRTRGFYYIALFFLMGMILFSGSIYALLLLKHNLPWATKYIGWITPVGGLVLIGAWLSIFLTLMRLQVGRKAL